MKILNFPAKLTLLVLFFLPPEATQANSKNFHFEFTMGQSISNGTYEWENFYSPSLSIAVEMGYKVSPYVILVPVCASFNNFRFNQNAYVDNYWEYFDEEFCNAVIALSRVDYSMLADTFEFGVINFEASSQFLSVSFTPGMMFISPEFFGLRSFCPIGAGLYHSQSSVDIQYDYHASWTNDGTQNDRSTFNFNNLCILVGGGAEYLFGRLSSLIIKLRYLYINSDSNKTLAAIRTPFRKRDYYLTGRGWHNSPVKDDKNMQLFQAMLGLRFYF